MRNYYRIMAGKGSAHSRECRDGGFIGVDFDIHQDLTGRLPDSMREFNDEFIPVFQENVPGKSKIAAGLACGFLWTVAKGVQQGDVVLSPDGSGMFHVGEVVGDYVYEAQKVLPHRRPVRWSDHMISRSAMSDALRRASGSIGTVSNITPHAVELESLLGHGVAPKIVSTDPEVEDVLEFAMEKHLEDFLVSNWSQTALADEWVVYEEGGEVLGQQYNTDAGRIDVLARSKDGRRLLVVELKRGRATDVVVGQVLRYMGYIKDQVAEKDQTVEGAIIALEDDQKLRWALSAVQGVAFYRYQVSFKLFRSDQ